MWHKALDPNIQGQVKTLTLVFSRSGLQSSGALVEGPKLVQLGRSRG